MRQLSATPAIAFALLCVAACGPSGPPEVGTIQLGRSLNSDNTVGGHTTRFKPTDTIYVSVLTVGPGAGTIGARWRYAGRIVSEPEQKVSYTREAATEFHMQNSGGFPVGSYSVEILVDGEPAGSRDFRVDR